MSQCPEKRQTNITNNANNNVRCEVLWSLVACGRSTASIRCLPSSFEISTFRFGFRRKTRSRRKLASHVAISSLWKAHLGRAKKSCWHPCESVNPLSQGTDGNVNAISIAIVSNNNVCQALLSEVWVLVELSWTQDFFHNCRCCLFCNVLKALPLLFKAKDEESIEKAKTNWGKYWKYIK